ncbi:TolC family protein [Paludisphaera borealis]|uniref:Cation efflux system protein CusC n=1 Tax=Paludisphaera borealis TaxID=1387353 RepID=A0A1U7CKP5_9BACT|nr:TolC family protein [Paludisphaera borealis]APW59478.1 Cation efflux system protein CusC [Paludisphaera borealis]
MNQSVSLANTKHKQRAVAIAMACSFLLVLPSCGIPALRYPKPGPGVPDSFDLRKADPKSDLPDVFDKAISSENSAQVRIEDFFNDPMLTGLMYTALGGNQELRILIENVQIASNEIMSRQGAYLPFVFLGGGVGVDKVSNYTLPGAGIRDDPFRPGMFLPNPLPNFLLGPTFLWTPDIWRQLHNAKDAAAARYYAAAEARNYFVTRMLADIAENYYQLMALDKRLEILDQTIALQERSLEVAKSIKEGARGTELPVQRFLAEVRRNQSEKLIVNQDIIETENRINFLLGRNPQRVERMSGDFIDLSLHELSIGVPPQLLQNRPDIRQAERELAAAGLDVKVARKRFYPQMLITSGVGYQAFDPRYLFITPEALIANVAGNLIAPFINKKAIRADYLSADARQLQCVYNYQRVVLNAFTEVINRLSKVENYRNSIEIKKQQLAALEKSVQVAMSLFQFARADYVDVLFAQRDLRDARTVTVETKQQQLSAIIDTYQALGGGSYLLPISIPKPLQSHHWKLWRHSKASEEAEPIPTPMAAAAGPEPTLPSTPAAAEGPEPIPPPPPAAAGGPEPTLAPTPAAPGGLEPLPAPATTEGPEPLPATTEGGKGPGTAP